MSWIMAHIAEQFAAQGRVRRMRTREWIRRTAPAYSAPGYTRLGAPLQTHRYSPTRERILTTV